MSVQALTAALRYKASNSTEKLVLIIVANYADGAGYTYEPQATICEDGSMSPDSVGRALKALETSKAITRSRRSRSDGTRTSDRIRITVDQNGEPNPQSAELIDETDPQNAAWTDDANTADRGVGLTRSERESLGLGTREIKPRPREVEIAALVWPSVPERHQTDPNKVKLVAAIKIALHAGYEADELVLGLQNYYRFKAEKGGTHPAKAPHYALGDGTWVNFAKQDDVHPRAGASAKTPPAELDALTADLGTNENPGPRRQRSWMEDWVDHEPRLRLSHWRENRGPPPGEQGCRVSADLQREFGETPFEDKADGAR